MFFRCGCLVGVVLATPTRHPRLIPSAGHRYRSDSRGGSGRRRSGIACRRADAPAGQRAAARASSRGATRAQPPAGARPPWRSRARPVPGSAVTTGHRCPPPISGSTRHAVKIRVRNHSSSRRSGRDADLYRGKSAPAILDPGARLSLRCWTTAANGSWFWAPEQLRSWFEGDDPKGAVNRLADWLGRSEDEPESVADESWQATGNTAGRTDRRPRRTPAGTRRPLARRGTGPRRRARDNRGTASRPRASGLPGERVLIERGRRLGLGLHGLHAQGYWREPGGDQPAALILGYATPRRTPGPGPWMRLPQ